MVTVVSTVVIVGSPFSGLLITQVSLLILSLLGNYVTHPVATLFLSTLFLDSIGSCVRLGDRTLSEAEALPNATYPPDAGYPWPGQKK